VIDLEHLDGVWKDAGVMFDSAVRATGGRYKWTYRYYAHALPEVIVNPGLSPRLHLELR
jgi:hypothetical protein